MSLKQTIGLLATVAVAFPEPITSKVGLVVIGGLLLSIVAEALI